MKKMESTLTNMVLVLVATALIMGGLLAFVNQITLAPIKTQADKTLAEGIRNVMGGGNLKVTKTDTVQLDIAGKTADFVRHQTENPQGKWLGTAVESTTQGFSGDLKVLIGFDPEGNILGYTILESGETPGLGAKADKWFQTDGKGSIIGKHPEKNKLAVTKGGEGEIDAITASTITSRAFLRAVNNAYRAYNEKSVDSNTEATQIKHQEKKGEEKP